MQAGLRGPWPAEPACSSKRAGGVCGAGLHLCPSLLSRALSSWFSAPQIPFRRAGVFRESLHSLNSRCASTPFTEGTSQCTPGSRRPTPTENTPPWPVFWAPSHHTDPQQAVGTVLKAPNQNLHPISVLGFKPSYGSPRVHSSSGQVLTTLQGDRKQME